MSIVLGARTVSALVVVLVIASASAAGAQAWEWDVAAHTVDQTTVPARSRVAMDRGDLVMTYSALADGRSVPITSCRAKLTDIASAQTVTNGGQPFLYVVMKTKHAARCGTGRDVVALTPIGTDATAAVAVAAIANACCRIGAQPARARSAATAETWIERDRWYAFVRLRNRGPGMLIVTGGAVDHCRYVTFGCGRFPERALRLAPGAAATLATVMVRDARPGAGFTYWYAVRRGTRRTSGSGNSDRRDGPRHTMSARELRSAEIAAAALRTRRSDPARGNVAARLVRRGSTRLGAGRRGIARVRVRVGADGLPKDAAIVSISNHALTAAALEVAVSSRYAPAMRGGRPQNADYLATFRF